MLHAIGKKSAGGGAGGQSDVGDDLEQRLLDCHARIREMTALAKRLASEPKASAEDRAEAAARVRRYFTRALPLHVRDEEESIHPRLANAGGDVARALARMKSEHGEHESHVAALVEACGRIADDASEDRWSATRGDVLAAAEALESAFVTHLAEEEAEIFPLLMTALDAAARAAIVAEMQDRRDRTEGGGGGRRGQGRGGGGGGGGGRGAGGGGRP